MVGDGTWVERTSLCAGVPGVVHAAARYSSGVPVGSEAVSSKAWYGAVWGRVPIECQAPLPERASKATS